MAESLRGIGSIAAGVAGYAIGGPLGFAVSTVLFNFLVPPTGPKSGPKSRQLQGDKNTAINTAIFQVFGRYEREGGDLIRCALDANGQRSGIFIETKKSSSKGSGPSKQQGTEKEVQYLSASFAVCRGETRITRIIETNGTDGEIVKWAREGTLTERGGWQDNTQYNLRDKVSFNRGNWECIKAHVSNNDIDPGDKKDNDPPATNYRTYWREIKNGTQINFTPIYGAITGREIGLMSDQIRIYYGSNEQQPDAAEASWYPDGVSADKGICKVVFNRYGPMEGGANFKFELENDLNTARKIILSRATDAAIPVSRVYLDSIPENEGEVGWFCEGRESARQLAEEVAALHLHDLHFMARDVGMCFTDISRENPTRFVITDEQMGAFANNGGGGQPPSSSGISMQTGEQKPRQIFVGFKNYDQNYKDDDAPAFWSQAKGNSQTITLRVIDRIDKISDYSKITMREIQASGGTTEVALMPSFVQVAPGCLLDVPEPERGAPDSRRLLRVIAQTITPETILANSCSPYDPLAYADLPLMPIVKEPRPQATTIAVPEILFVDSVSITDEMAGSANVIVAAYAPQGTQFRGAILTSDTASFDATEIGKGATVGTLLAPYNYDNAALGYFDYTTTLPIALEAGALASCTEAQVIAGANILCIGGCYLAFTTATPTGDLTYDITGILPGLFGSDHARALAQGAPALLIANDQGESEGWRVLPIRNRAIGTPTTYRVASGYDSTVESEQETTTFVALNLTALGVDPFISKARDEDGNIGLRFYGRSRFPSNATDSMLIGFPFRQSDPLSWNVKLKSGATVVNERTATSANSEVTINYTAAELTAMFGAPPEILRGEITQNGTYGPGFTVQFSV